MAVTEKISKLVQNQFPDFYKEDGQNFLAFIEAYYAWMEETGQMTDAIRNLESYRDISTTTEEYLKYFESDLLPSIPTTVIADKRLMAKYIGEFNRSRGTFAAYRLMFRAIYGEDIDLNLPSEQILKVSDGDWRIDRYLVTPYDKNTYDFIGKTIVGSDSGAIALVEDVVRRTIRGLDVMQILLSRIVGTFVNEERIHLQTDTSVTGHAPIIQAGINSITITAAGGGYVPGDIVQLSSSQVGEFGRVLVKETIDLGGTLSFAVTEGGSGYRASTTNPGSTITFGAVSSGSGASFEIEPDDIHNTIPIYVNWDRIGDYNAFGPLLSAVVLDKEGNNFRMDTFANNIIGSPRYGFIEQTVPPAYVDFYDNINAVLSVANTSDPNITVGDSLYGVTSGANAIVVSTVQSYNSSNVVLTINGYKNFSDGEMVTITDPSGTTVGHVAGFSGNTAGYHVLNIANTQAISEGQELVGVSSGAYGVVKFVVEANDANTYVRVTANTTANLTSQFDTGPLKAYTSGENIRLVNTSTVVGTAKATTSNSEIENVYTALEDALIFASASVGSIRSLSSVSGGSDYITAPTVDVIDTDISRLKVREYVLTLQNDDVEWGTGNSNFTVLSSADRIETSGASGYVVGASVYGEPIAVSQYGNGTYETSVRVWQDVGETVTGLTFANNGYVTIKTYLGSYTTGNPEPDARTLTNTGNAQIVLVTDNGILGENATVTPTVGANGTIVAFNIVDSGFSYRDGEEVEFGIGTGPLATGASGIINLRGAANSEGYYATSRSHISSLRGYIQDGDYFQEYSYEILSPVSLARYRDVALKLVHPAGQKLFGKYRLQSNAFVDMTVDAGSKRRNKANGTIAISNTSFTITGSGTSFTNHFANNGSIIIEYAPRSFYTIPLNIVSSDTLANTKIAWANTNLTSANIYYTTGSTSANIYYQVA